MTDLYSDYSNNKGNPQLDKDYWKNQKNNSEKNDKTENYNLFDNLIKTNFDIENLKSISVFKSKNN